MPRPSARQREILTWMRDHAAVIVDLGDVFDALTPDPPAPRAAP